MPGVARGRQERSGSRKGNGTREHALSLSPGAVSYLVAAAHSPQSGATAPAIWKEGGPRQVPTSRAGGLDRVKPSLAPIPGSGDPLGCSKLTSLFFQVG